MMKSVEEKIKMGRNNREYDAIVNSCVNVDVLSKLVSVSHYTFSPKQGTQTHGVAFGAVSCLRE